MTAFLWIPAWWWHPLNGQGYQWWSGIGSDIGEVSIAAAIFAGLAGWWHHHKCHVTGCRRLAWHPHPEHEHPVCRRHHPHFGTL